MKEYVIAGNWKMNNTVSEGVKLVNDIKEKILKRGELKRTKIILAVPYLHIISVKEAISEIKIFVSAQNCHEKEKGAYTGEVSASMLLEAGVDYVIIGHSERRKIEQDEVINLKMISALKTGLKVILCVGENEKFKNFGLEKVFVKQQIEKAFKSIDIKREISNIIIAYEPIWAIGTGRVADKSDAKNMSEYIKNYFEEAYGIEYNQVKVLYGGSVNQNTVEDFLTQDSIDGVLIGGASLSADEFFNIINQAENI